MKSSATKKEIVFDLYSQYYDLLYLDKDYQREIDYIRGLLLAAGIKEGKILELGSGTGIHANLLANSNYHVTGIDQSQEMVNRSQKNKQCTFLTGDMTTFRLSQKFDAVISLFHVVSYLTTNDQVSKLFENVKFHLLEGGVFIFDVWYSPCVNFLQPGIRVKRIIGEDVAIMRIAEPEILDNENIVNVQYTIYVKKVESGEISSFQEIHSMRHFSIPEISNIAKMHGFEVIKSEEFLSAKPPGKDTWGVCFFLKKIAD